MKSRDFCYWLQGFFELEDLNKNPKKTEIAKDQVECIRKHLNMVFCHEIDPSMGGKEHQGLENLAQSITEEETQVEETEKEQNSTANIPDYMNSNLTEEELDAKYDIGI